MKKRLLAVLLAGVLTAISAAPVFATETESVEGEEAVEEETEAESAGIEIPTGNMVDVDVIDLCVRESIQGKRYLKGRCVGVLCKTDLGSS